MVSVKRIADWIRHQAIVRNEQAFQQGSWNAVADAIEKRFGEKEIDMSDSDKMIKEALANGFALVIYQTAKGPSYGVVEVDAISEVVGREDQDGGNYFASAIVTAEGGDIQKVDNPTTSVMKALTGLWGTAREMFVE